MICRIAKFTSQVLYTLCLATTLFVVLIPAAFSKGTVVPVTVTKQQSTVTQVKLQPQKADKAELKRFCSPGQTTTSKRGSKTTYTCQFNPEPGSMSIKARPGTVRADINCDYSEQGGVNTWLGCTCKSNDDGNCNSFISNCVEGGDDVGGNSGGASCSPPGG